MEEIQGTSEMFYGLQREYPQIVGEGDKTKNILWFSFQNPDVLNVMRFLKHLNQ